MKPVRELIHWHFTKDHDLVGVVKYDETKRYKRGEGCRIDEIIRVNEEGNCFRIETPGIVYILPKDKEIIRENMARYFRRDGWKFGET